MLRNPEDFQIAQKQSQLDAAYGAALHSDIELKLSLIDAYLQALRNRFDGIADEILLPIAADLASKSPIKDGVPVIKNKVGRKS